MSKTYIILTATLILIILIITFIGIVLIKNKKKNIENIYYRKLFFLRKSELKFLKTISVFENEYIIVPKLSIKKIIKSDYRKYKKELKNLTVDYAIFSKDYFQVILLIELTYQSNETNNLNKIDKLRKICKEADIKFITFATDENNQEYIIDKIEQIIKENI